MFNCETDRLGHIVLGSHDGVNSWTLHLASEADQELQTFISAHERAHHYLHSTSAWGVAMLVCGLPAVAGEVAAAAWSRLGSACRTTHEQFATYQAVHGNGGDIKFLMGNFAYLAHLRSARRLLTSFDISLQARIADNLYRAVMSPRWLAERSAADLRAGHGLDDELQTAGPDSRLSQLAIALAEGATADGIEEIFGSDGPHGERWDALASLLERIGIPTLTWIENDDWIHRVADEFSRQSARTIVLELAGQGDQLSALLDEQQRERLQLHSAPLLLKTSQPSDLEPEPAASFVRTAPEVGPHLVLAWLHTGTLRQQFQVSTGDDGLQLGFLACDRRTASPFALWSRLDPAPPSVIGLSVKKTAVTPLFFTTLRSLEQTPPEIDFRGWDPTFVLVDSDVLAFLTAWVDGGTQMQFDIMGTRGSRSVDFILFHRVVEPGVIYVFPCSTATGRVVVAWMSERPKTFARSRVIFLAVQPTFYALVEHLLGTFWRLDLWGWEPHVFGS